VKLSCEDALADDAVEIERIEIDELLSAPFLATVFFFTPVEANDVESIVADLVGTMAHVTYGHHHVHGIVADVTSMSRERNRPAQYRARIVPRFAMLGLVRRSRV